MGSKEPIRRNFLLYAVTISVKLSKSSWFLYRMKPRLYKFPKILKLWSKGRPVGGFERSQNHFRKTNSFLYVMPDKRHNYSQNHFKSTFGSSYFKPNKTKLKLAKTMKKEPRKASKLSLGSCLAVWESNEICTY